MLVLHGVSYAYKTAGKRYKHTRSTKKYPYAYFYNANGSIYRKKISKFEFIISKYFKIKYNLRKKKCKVCNYTFQYLTKNKSKSRITIKCPVCQ